MALAAAAVIVTSLPSAIAAQSPAPPASQKESVRELPASSFAGDYLAARHANAGRDSASASAYYKAALESDPNDPDLLELAFYAVLADGEIEEAVKLGERLLKADRNAHNPNVRLVLGVRALERKQYGQARTQLARATRGPVSDLIATLLAGWAYEGSRNWRGAIEALDRLNGPDWYQIFKDLHAGLILDVAGRSRDAGKRFERAYNLDSSALRVVEAYASWLSRNGRSDEAMKVLETFDSSLPRHPLVRDAMDKLRKGETLPRLVDTPSAGAAEALYGLGAALARREEELSLANRGLAYLQLALWLEPHHPLALLSLADLYEAMKKPEQAIAVYAKVPTDSVLHRNAEVQMALDLDQLDRTDEARETLSKLIEAHPDDVEAILALGNILRDRKKYAECADTYSKAIERIDEPTRANWTVFYFRGICYERSKQWKKAEADLKKALELSPDQPHVLNYLGYSWIDQGVNLDEAMDLIRRAVEQRPDDGYIVDSLGWAYYRIGNVDEAIKNLERAVELKPMDPTINDHLGDAYWKAGRQLEAKFQWTHARDLKPEPDDLAKIEQKLKNGLAGEPSTAADADKPKPADAAATNSGG
ncbi:tetratricopeptide repeat protein [Rhodovulum sp. PH10]|uniref:tetratricopeptide repeat protein n=1 Tax=Rhodovulum sp. PH10 TaxID=1187851 RepID=UPI00192C1718|nr:tetratricopeptide repeat protein [Rhodovulum sp. PH10]